MTRASIFSSSARIDAANVAVASSSTAVARRTSAVYVAISSASEAHASLAFLSTFSSPPEPRRRLKGVLPSASTWTTAPPTAPNAVMTGFEPGSSSSSRRPTRSAWRRVSARWVSRPVRYPPPGVIAICACNSRVSACSIACASLRYCRTFCWDELMEPSSNLEDNECPIAKRCAKAGQGGGELEIASLADPTLAARRGPSRSSTGRRCPGREMMRLRDYEDAPGSPLLLPPVAIRTTHRELLELRGLTFMDLRGVREPLKRNEEARSNRHNIACHRFDKTKEES